MGPIRNRAFPLDVRAVCSWAHPVEGRKTNAAMVSVAKSLDDKQMAALAAYFSTLPQPAGSAQVDR